MTFEQELRLENRLRQEREYNAILKRKINGETIYTLYCVWCNAYGTEEMKTNEDCFREWLKQEREELKSKWYDDNCNYSLLEIIIDHLVDNFDIVYYTQHEEIYY
jgi:hypothetical protein